MKSRRVSYLLALVGLVALFTMWVFFAPTGLGGSTTYSITDGISMKPFLVANDLALIRPQSSYQVGDVVLYDSQVLHKPVLHRIILIQNGNFFFKGDNNDFVDPGYATRAELVGKLWFRIPWAGTLLGWFGKPLHAALLAGGAAMAVVLTGTSGGSRRRRRRRRGAVARPRALLTGPERETVAMTTPEPDSTERRSSAVPRSPTQERRSGIAMTPSQLATRRAPTFLEGPKTTLILLAAIALLSVLCLGVGYSRPYHRSVPLPGAYQQAGTFSYTAAVKKPTPVYPSGSATTGDPIYPGLVSSVVLKFRYRFTSPLAHSIKGTIELGTLLLSNANTWQQLNIVKKSAPFTGDSVDLTASLPLAGLYTLINSVSAQSGLSGAVYSADIQPVIHITGTVGNQKISQTFAPVLPFTVAPTAITLNAAVTAAPPGATYITPSTSTALAATLHPTVSGSVPHLVSNVVSIAKYEIRVPLLRILGIIFGALALLIALLHDLIRRRKSVGSVETQIATRLGVLVVPVASLASADRAEVIDVSGFASLAGLAKYLERPILYDTRNGERTYEVDDESRRYRYQPPTETLNAPTAPAPKDDVKPPRTQTPTAKPSRQRHRGRQVAQASAVLVVFLVIGGVVTSFTASTNVPTSYVGSSNQPLAVTQLAPLGCNSLTLSALVQGSGTFSSSTSNALVLGSAGTDTITDTGTGNCIIGGGGADVIRGTSSDICITGPTLDVAAPCPLSGNGVTVTPSSTNFNNYGGQERLTLTNTASITSLTITITVARTAGVSYNSQGNSYPGGTINQHASTSRNTITYTFVLASHQTIAAGYSGGSVYAQFSGNGGTHDMHGDTWTVTSKSGGITSTLSGTF